MKKYLLILLFTCLTIGLKAQLKKDGTPDMRYKANKEIYGNSYSTPSYSTPSYSTPSYNSYPTRKDGTPDMRYKANRDLYGTSTTGASSNTNVYYSAPSAPNTTNSYNRSNGTYVQTYYSTKPNKTNHDNYSTSGNINPYTGASGSRAQDNSAEAYNYGAGYEIKTGDRGGQYYINRMGKKAYVPKRN